MKLAPYGCPSDSIAAPGDIDLYRRAYISCGSVVVQPSLCMSGVFMLKLVVLLTSFFISFYKILFLFLCCLKHCKPP